MKALTLTQPWATLIALGQKRIETRSWATSYRGPLAIHAAAGYGKGGMRGHKAICAQEAFSAVLTPALKDWWSARRDLADVAAHPFMPMGAIVAVCKLVDCRPTDPLPSLAYRCGEQRWWLTEQEDAFGDYSPGRYAWLLSDIRALPEPIPAKGALSLWEWDGQL